MKSHIVARWATALIVSLFVGGSAWSQGTGYPYYPLTSGTSITYQVFVITGTWHPTEGKLDVNSRTYVNSQTIYYYYSLGTCPSFFGQGPLFLKYYTVGGPVTPSPTPIPSQSLQDGGWVSSNGITYIGEAINNLGPGNGNVEIPFIGLLTKNPVAGEIMNETTTVYSACDNPTVIEYLPWSYRTIEHLAQWGDFADVWRTGLWERNTSATDGNHQPIPGAKDRVYNFIFQNGVGMVNFWYGKLQSDNTLYYDPSNVYDLNNGYEYYAISHQ